MTIINYYHKNIHYEKCIWMKLIANIEDNIMNTDRAIDWNPFHI